MGLKVFIHACAITNVFNIFYEFMIALHFSGLYDEADAIYVGIVGKPELASSLREYVLRCGKKFQILHFTPDDPYFEKTTLEKVHPHVTVDDKVLYIHTKGVCHCSLNIDDWRLFMLYHLVKRFKECVQKLDEGYDTVGCNFKDEDITQPHFSGNFWWVTGKYFLTLPHDLSFDRFDNEKRFLFTNKPKHYCISDTASNHYHYLHPPTLYVD